MFTYLLYLILQTLLVKAVNYGEMKLISTTTQLVIFILFTDKALYDQSAEDVDELLTVRSVGRSADRGSMFTRHRSAISHLLLHWNIISVFC